MVLSVGAKGLFRAGFCDLPAGLTFQMKTCVKYAPDLKFQTTAVQRISPADLQLSGLNVQYTKQQCIFSFMNITHLTDAKKKKNKQKKQKSWKI